MDGEKDAGGKGEKGRGFKCTQDSSLRLPLCTQLLIWRLGIELLKNDSKNA